MAESVSVRIGEDELLEIEKISKFEKKTKSEVLRSVLDKGIKEKKLEIAIRRFSNNEMTVASAAKLADVCLSEFLDLLSERKIRFHYGLKELEKDFEGLI